MEEGLQETSSSNNKKTSFLSMSISKKTLIIVVCSVVCFLAVLLLFFVMSSNNRKTHAQSFSRPSINGPKRPSGRNVEKQNPEQRPQAKPPMQNSEGIRRSAPDNPQRRIPRGIFQGETPEQESQRHLREMERRKDPNYRPQERIRSNERRHRRDQQKKSSSERERPKLNS
ncbi:MAG: hypothetical protein J6T23_04080 [Elusimicrobia bacterium]|nr:hypothetical protein [Elusimicrobiota bacterium]